MYVQDDWRVRPTVTLNIGLRYAPTTDPHDAFNQLYDLLPVPFGQTGNLPSGTDGSGLHADASIQLHVKERLPAQYRSPHRNRVGPVQGSQDVGARRLRDIPPDHVLSRLSQRLLLSLSLGVKNQTSGTFDFPFPNQSPVTSPTTETNGTNPYNTTPYLQQWNLSIQREIMKNTVITVAYVGSHGVHLLGEQDANPPVPVGGLTQLGTGGLQINGGQTVYPSFAGEFNGIVSAPVFNSNGTVGAPGAITVNANGSISCAAASTACSLASPTGQAIVDPATAQVSFSHIVQAASYSIVANNHTNPNFSYMNNGVTNLWSRYNALQIGFVRRLTDNLSSQVSYTYSDCTDISSGDWTQEGGTIIADAYNYNVDRGACVFMIRHNLTANFLYILPFQKNRLVSGWQVGGIFYFATGGPFHVTTFS